jgi:hypothetical protein
MPHVTEETKVIRDITSWREFTKVPDLLANCSDQQLWIPYLERMAQIDRENNLVMAFAPTGLFERLHFLMGFEDTFVNLMTDPEAMADLCRRRRIPQYGMKLMADIAHPDIILSHDDWGQQDKPVHEPGCLARVHKPNYFKAYGYLKSKASLIYAPCRPPLWSPLLRTWLSSASIYGRAFCRRTTSQGC